MSVCVHVQVCVYQLKRCHEFEKEQVGGEWEELENGKEREGMM